MSAISVAIATCIAIVAVALVMVAQFLMEIQGRMRWDKKLQRKIPPGSMGLPVLGESIQYLLAPGKFVEKRRKLYGGMFSTSILGYPTVYSTDPEVNKFVLNEGRVFAPRYPNSLNELTGKWNITLTRGDLHKKMRGATMALASASVLKDRLFTCVENIIISTLQTWEGRTVNVLHEAQHMTFSFMAHQLMSIPQGEELETMKRDFEVLKKGLFALPIKAPGTTYSKSFQKRQQLLNRITRIVEERIKSLPDIRHDDLLSMLLKAEDNKFQLTTDQIFDLILGLLLGGYDTTSRAIALVVRRLSENIHVIPELRAEHEAIRKNKKHMEMLSWSDYKSMAFTRDVIKETLRFGLGFNQGLYRETLENVEMQGYTIPKGWTFVVHGFSAAMDSKYYRDALTFDPWRWKEPNQAYFSPFGGGARLCPGNELAMLEVCFFIHHLVTRFRWDWIAPKTKPGLFDSSDSFINNILIHPKQL